MPNLEIKPDVDRYHPRPVQFAEQKFLVPMLTLEPDEKEQEIYDLIDEYEIASENGLRTSSRVHLEKSLARKSLELIYQEVPEKIGLDRPSFRRLVRCLLGIEQTD